MPELKFRFNGSDLQIMKNVAITNDPQKAVEYFIAAAIKEGMLPEEYLKKTREDIERILNAKLPTGDSHE